MKKVLLFVSTIFFSLLLVNKVYAQPKPIRQPPFGEYPIYITKAKYMNNFLIQENANTYEYEVSYLIQGVLIDTIGDNDYFIVNDIGLGFKKGLDRRTNTYEIVEVFPNPAYNTTIFRLHITVLKSFLRDNYPSDLYYWYLFRYDTALYIYISDLDAVENYYRGYNEGYNRGHNDGYNNGFNDGRVFGEKQGYGLGYSDGYYEGYNDGYTDGIITAEPEAYQRGYNDGAKSSFIGNLHVWIVPAIIIVIIAGIFVGYRRERYDGD